jgi:hypothetical protein
MVTTFRSLDSYRNCYELLIRNIQADRRPVIIARSASPINL